MMPLRVGTTSSGRKALPDTLFSTAGTSSRSRTGSLAAITIDATAITVAAPPMSFFMLSMPDAGLRSRPPVSKHTPLPTSVTLGSLSLPQVRSISRGARTLARPTAWIIGKFCFSRSSPTVTLILAPCFLASSCAAAASSAGPMSDDGVVMRSRARQIDSIIAVARALSAPCGHRIFGPALPFFAL